jgi:uncharacterized membrane protein
LHDELQSKPLLLALRRAVRHGTDKTVKTPSKPDIDLTLKRNCSITPHALARMMILLAVFSLGIGAGFAVLGLWMVLPFAGLEVAALAVAFVLHARHAADYERIRTDGERVLVEVREGDTTWTCELERRWLHVNERREGRDLRVALAARGTEIEVGRHMDAARRRELATALRRQLV